LISNSQNHEQRGDKKMCYLDVLAKNAEENEYKVIIEEMIGNEIMGFMFKRNEKKLLESDLLKLIKKNKKGIHETQNSVAIIQGNETIYLQKKDYNLLSKLV